MEKQTQPTTETYQLTLSQKAIQNIDEITNYIAIVNQQPLNAIKVIDAIFEAIDKIKEMPYAFKECGLMPTKNKCTARQNVLSGT